MAQLQLLNKKINVRYHFYFKYGKFKKKNKVIGNGYYTINIGNNFALKN